MEGGYWPVLRLVRPAPLHQCIQRGRRRGLLWWQHQHRDGFSNLQRAERTVRRLSERGDLPAHDAIPEGLEQR